MDVWDFLLQNPMRITKELFSKMLKKSLETSVCSPLIVKDLERTFFYFFKHKVFSNIVLEAKNVLLLWEVSEPITAGLPTRHQIHPRNVVCDGFFAVDDVSFSRISSVFQFDPRVELFKRYFHV